MLPHKIKALWEQCKSKSNILFKSIKEQTDNYSDVSFYIAIICICSFIILYYPVGAILTNNINRNLDIKIDKISPNQSMAIDMVSHLINEEVNEKIWTPNLPFFFPAAILDNMPNYQLGILNSLSKFTSALEKSNHKKTKDEEYCIFKIFLLYSVFLKQNYKVPYFLKTFSFSCIFMKKSHFLTP